MDDDDEDADVNVLEFDAELAKDNIEFDVLLARTDEDEVDVRFLREVGDVEEEREFFLIKPPPTTFPLIDLLSMPLDVIEFFC